MMQQTHTTCAECGALVVDGRMADHWEGHEAEVETMKTVMDMMDRIEESAVSTRYVRELVELAKDLVKLQAQMISDFNSMKLLLDARGLL